MALDPHLNDLVWSSGPHRWDADSVALYALAVGAGPAELEYATGYSVLPAFPTTLIDLSAQPPFGTFDPAMLLHTQQSIFLHRPISIAGIATTSSRIVGVFDAGPSAIVNVETTCSDEAGVLAELASSLTIRREGGFGGDSPPEERWVVPARQPDRLVRYQTSTAQALLYRLTGDRNRLHWDIEVARKVGLRAPILHGLCTFGYAARALVKTRCGGDVEQFGEMRVRFTAPVYPGDALAVWVWDQGEGAVFQVRTERGKVLDGRFRRRGYAGNLTRLSPG